MRSIGPLSTRRILAHAIHLYTATGLVFVLLALREIISSPTDPRWVFGWLGVALFVDATDGLLARRFAVKEIAPLWNGRTIDNIVDYLSFTLVPMVLVCEMDWLPEPAYFWGGVAMVTSVFGFARISAKDEANSAFIGFPSYWNIFAWYAGLFATQYGVWLPFVVLVVLVSATFIPVRFLYPTHAPEPWRLILIGGGLIWAGLLVYFLPGYPHWPDGLIWGSLVYPLGYLLGSAYFFYGSGLLNGT